MEIKSNLNGDELKVELSGELNALTAPELSTFLAPHLENDGFYKAKRISP